MLRVCYASGAFMGFTDDGKAIGPMAELGNLLLLELSGYNFTLTKDPAIGDVVDQRTKQYDGCIGSLQRNQSDLLLGTANHPISGSNLTQGPPNGFMRMGIFSAYKRPEIIDTNHTQVLGMVTAFTPGLWVAIISLLAIISVLFVTSFSKSAGKKTTKLITACILRQHSSIGSKVRKAGSRILYFSATLLCFYSAFYLMSMIKTDMVIIRSPDTIESYQDILDSGVRPA